MSENLGGIRKVVKIDGIPVGWAWVMPPSDFDGDPIVIRDLLIHENHIAKNDKGQARITLGWTSTDMDLPAEPVPTGFYHFPSGPNGILRVFLKTGPNRWLMMSREGTLRDHTWASLCREYNLKDNDRFNKL